MQSQRIGKLETAATRIRNFAPTAVVGLLQTEDYVDALLGDWLSGEDRTRMIASRMERQRLLDTSHEFSSSCPRVRCAGIWAGQR